MTAPSPPRRSFRPPPLPRPPPLFRRHRRASPWCRQQHPPPKRRRRPGAELALLLSSRLRASHRSPRLKRPSRRHHRPRPPHRPRPLHRRSQCRLRKRSLPSPRRNRSREIPQARAERNQSSSLAPPTELAVRRLRAIIATTSPTANHIVCGPVEGEPWMTDIDARSLLPLCQPRVSRAGRCCGRRTSPAQTEACLTSTNRISADSGTLDLGL